MRRGARLYSRATCLFDELDYDRFSLCRLDQIPRAQRGMTVTQRYRDRGTGERLNSTCRFRWSIGAERHAILLPFNLCNKFEVLKRHTM